MKSRIVFAGSPRYPEDEASQKKRDNDKHVNNAKKLGKARVSQLIFKAEDPYERCGYEGCEHPRANHRISSAGRGFCLECQGSRPGAISSDVVHEFEPKAGITGSTGPTRHVNPVPATRVRVPHPNSTEVHMHHEALLTGLEQMRARFHGTARDKTEKSRRSQRTWRR